MSAAVDEDYVLSNVGDGVRRVWCPACGPSRKDKRDKSLSIRRDDEGVGWRCWHCGTTGIIKERQERQMKVQEAKAEQPVVVPMRQFETAPLTEEAIDYLSGRGISEEIATLCGVVSGTKYFRKAGAEKDAVGFVYRWKSRDYAAKWRSLEGKDFTQDGAAQTLYLGDKLAGRDAIIITEGEVDALSFWQAGLPFACSIPSGAMQAQETDDAARLKWMAHCEELITAAKNIFLAVDNDGPGQATAQVLARRIGKAKCWKVSYPEGCKDANDVLLKHGPDAVQALISSAKPWPVEGLASPSEYADKVINLYRKGLPRGLSSGWPAVDEYYTLNPGNLVIVTGVPGHGKALALDTEIPTPNGWTTMGEIAVGDEVYAPDGSVTKVIRVSEVMERRECWELSFKDGGRVIADADHQWVTRDDKARRSARNTKKQRGEREETKSRGKDQRHLKTYPSSKTTREIAETLIVKGRFNHAVQRIEPISGAGWPCPVPPYTLGAWLGDGTSSSGGITSADEEVINEIRSEGFEVRKSAPVYGWYIQDLKGRLREAGVLDNKHIPQALLRASAQDRLSLLQGLMDTDGSVCALYPGCSEFVSMSERLACDVFDLAASLGLRPKAYSGPAKLNGKDCGTKYRVVMINTTPVFRLERKLKRIRVSSRSKAWHDWQQIVGAVPVKSVPVKCIMVDHPSHQFLVTRHLLPTHNSSWIDALLVNAMKQHKWHVAYASFENPPEIHASKLVALKMEKPFGFGPSPRMNEDEMEEGLDWLNRHVTFLTHDGVMPTTQSLIERFESSVLRSGTKACVIDPFNFLKLSNKKEGGVDTEAINEMLSELKMFAQRAEVVVFLVAHPAKPMAANNDWVPTGYSISGSAHFYNRADFGLTMHRKDGKNILHVWKARFAHQGSMGQVELRYDKPTGGFREPPEQTNKDDVTLDLEGFDESEPF